MFRNKFALITLLCINTQLAFANADGCMLRMPPQNDQIGVKVALNTADSVAKSEPKSLYQRLGGYDAIVAVVNDLMVRLVNDKQLGRFWAHRGSDGIAREKQLVIDFIVNKSGGALTYTGREMLESHTGMRISETDWQLFIGYLNETLDKFNVAEQEVDDVVNFMESLKDKMVGV